MSRYPRAARDAKIKCMHCNAPVTETVDGGYACVDCGRNPFGDDGPDDAASEDRDPSSVAGRADPEGDDGPGTASVVGTSLQESAPGRTSVADGETGVDGD